MTNQELSKKLLGYAKYDLRKVRKTGGMFITETKQGCLTVTYEASTKLYTIATDGYAYHVTGKAKEMAQTLADLYTVVQ